MASPPFSKVIVVGLDGLEPKLVQPMLRAGELPNLAKIAEQGAFSTIATTFPAQTPVAWSTFATGVNPGGHGIFDFVRRDPRTYLPDLGLSRYEQKNAFVQPKAVNLRRGTPVWDTLAAAGIPSSIIRCPCTYPAQTNKGRLLSGLGVPDIRGGYGTGAFYTATKVQQQEGEQIIEVQTSGNSPIQTYLPGPLDKKTRGPQKLDITIEPLASGNEVSIRISSGGDPVIIKERKWSPWVKVKFKLGFLQAAAGLVRFYLARHSPLELYASPIQFDPHEPMFPISAPADYAGELADRLGLYGTAGMIEDHSALNNGRLDEAAFLDQCWAIWNERQKMMMIELDRFKEGMMYCLFDTTDRVQHMFWRFLEEDHPANRGQGDISKHRNAINQTYKTADSIVGQAMKYVDDKTLLIVLSDHGFTSFRRGVNINTWLHQQGLLALKGGLKPGKEAGDLLLNIDWSKTKAYATGLTGLYLNIRDRERDGIVSADEAAALKEQICGGLTGLKDGSAVTINSATPREKVYRGKFLDDAPDVIINYNPPFRTSWTTALGGLGEELFEDNTRRWSGDHIVDPAKVPGVLFTNRALKPDARLLDMAPTIASALGAGPNAEWEGVSLLP